MFRTVVQFVLSCYLLLEVVVVVPQTSVAQRPLVFFVFVFIADPLRSKGEVVDEDWVGVGWAWRWTKASS